MNRLKELREKIGLSQEKLATNLAVNLRTLQRWENDETAIRKKNAEKIADYFGVSVGYLLGYSDYPDSTLRDILFYEIKTLKSSEIVRKNGKKFISKDAVLSIIDKYID